MSEDSPPRSEEVSKSLADLECKLRELEGELAAGKPAEEAKQRPSPASGAPGSSFETPRAPLEAAAAEAPAGGKADPVIVRDERPRAEAQGARSGAPQEARSGVDLGEARASVDRIATELRSGFDELIALRGRLEEARECLVEDYERLLARRESPADPPRD